MFSIKTFIDNSNRDETAVRQNKIHKKLQNYDSKQPKMVWNKLLLILLLLLLLLLLFNNNNNNNNNNKVIIIIIIVIHYY